MLFMAATKETSGTLTDAKGSSFPRSKAMPTLGLPTRSREDHHPFEEKEEKSWKNVILPTIFRKPGIKTSNSR